MTNACVNPLLLSTTNTLHGCRFVRNGNRALTATITSMAYTNSIVCSAILTRDVGTRRLKNAGSESKARCESTKGTLWPRGTEKLFQAQHELKQLSTVAVIVLTCVVKIIWNRLQDAFIRLNGVYFPCGKDEVSRYFSQDFGE